MDDVSVEDAAASSSTSLGLPGQNGVSNTSTTSIPSAIGHRTAAAASNPQRGEARPLQLRSLASPTSPPAGASSTCSPSRFLFPGAPYHAQLEGGFVVVPDLSSPPSAPHPLVQSAFAVAEEGGGCRLSLLEAFFLVHAFDALAVHCDGARMSAAALLSHAHSTELRFVQSFCAFAYWTALGWVVRRGSKLGVDFLLYPYRALSARTGRTHSTFSVLVLDDAAAAEGRAMSGPAQLEALLRVQHSTRKRLLVCCVAAPESAALVNREEALWHALSACRVVSVRLVSRGAITASPTEQRAVQAPAEPKASDEDIKDSAQSHLSP